MRPLISTQTKITDLKIRNFILGMIVATGSGIFFSAPSALAQLSPVSLVHSEVGHGNARILVRSNAAGEIKLEVTATIGATESLALVERNGAFELGVIETAKAEGLIVGEDVKSGGQPARQVVGEGLTKVAQLLTLPRIARVAIPNLQTDVLEISEADLKSIADSKGTQSKTVHSWMKSMWIASKPTGEIVSSAAELDRASLELARKNGQATTIVLQAVGNSGSGIDSAQLEAFDQRMLEPPMSG